MIYAVIDTKERSPKCNQGNGCQCLSNFDRSSVIICNNISKNTYRRVVAPLRPSFRHCKDNITRGPNPNPF